MPIKLTDNSETDRGTDINEFMQMTKIDYLDLNILRFLPIQHQCEIRKLSLLLHCAYFEFSMHAGPNKNRYFTQLRIIFKWD